MTLAELLANLERRAAEAEREGSSAPVANLYRLVLAELQALDAVPENGGVAAEDRLLTAEEAARRLGVRPRWLYDHAASLPFAVKLSPRMRRFSERGLRRWQERQR